MAMFGNNPMRKRKPWETPGIGDGMSEPMGEMSPGMGVMRPPTPTKPKFFGEGGTGRAIAGYIGDALLQQSGMQPIYQPAVRDQREAMARAEEQRRKALEPFKLNDSIVQADGMGGYKLVYQAPETQKPTALQQNYEYLKGLNPDLAEQFIRNEAEGSPVVASNGDGTFTVVPRSSVYGGQPAVPQAPVGKLKPLGGAAPRGAGGFRR